MYSRLNFLLGSDVRPGNGHEFLSVPLVFRLLSFLLANLLNVKWEDDAGVFFFASFLIIS
jgi:hypothetical protein